MRMVIEGLRTPLIGPVNLSIEAGQCVAIMGASGAGKSLILRAIVDLDLNQGEITLGDQARSRMGADDWRRTVALVPAESGWWEDKVGAHFPGASAATPWLTELDLSEAFDWDVDRLSSGERQRLALARALVSKPQALLLDEPTASLDDQATARVERLLKDQLALGVAIILVTHDARQAARMSHRVLLMDDGTLKESGTEGS